MKAHQLLLLASLVAGCAGTSSGTDGSTAGDTVADASRLQDGLLPDLQKGDGRVHLDGTEVPADAPPSVPEVLVTPAEVQFGAVAVGDTATQTVDVYNMGQADLVLEKVELEEGNHPGLKLSSIPDLPAAIAPGKHAYVDLIFSPSEPFPEEDSLLGTLHIETNDPDEAVVEVPIQATSSVPCLKLSPASAVDFGMVAKSWTSTRTLIIENMGTASLHVSSLEIIENTEDEEFAIADDPDFPPIAGTGDGVLLPPKDGEKSQVEVKLEFTNKGSTQSEWKKGKLRVASDDPAAPDVILDLSAFPVVDPECTLILVPAKLEFGNVAAGSSKTLSMFIKNAGSGFCSFKSATVKECKDFMGTMVTCSYNAGPSLQFLLLGLPVPVVDGLLPGAAYPVQVQFKPPTTVPGLPLQANVHGVFQVRYTEPYSVPGQYTEHAYPESDNLGNLYWNVHGTYGVPNASIVPAALDFGPVPMGCSSPPRCFQIVNTGSAELQVPDVHLDGCGSWFELVEPADLPLVVEPTGSAKVCVAFTPKTQTPTTCHCVVESDDPNAPVLEVTLTGEGTTDKERTEIFEQKKSRPVDLLFVVDAGGAMCTVHEKLVQAMGSFVTFAKAWGDDYQVGMIELDLAKESVGLLQGSPRILTAATIGDFGANLAASIGCSGTFGNQAGLEAARLSLTPPYLHDTDMPCACPDKKPCPGICDDPDLCVEGKCGGWNRGLVREDGALAVVFVSDAEDESQTPVGLYEEFFLGLKGPLSKDLVRVHAIVGDWNSGCSFGLGSADPGIRYINVQTVTSGVFGSICADSYGDTLKAIAGKAFGPRTHFTLSAWPDDSAGKIKVFLDKGSGFQECTKGWEYHSDSNSIELIEDGPCMPKVGNQLKIWYELACVAP